MVFFLKSVNLEELMSRENVNCIHQTVDTLSLMLFFSLKFRFQGDYL